MLLLLLLLLLLFHVGMSLRRCCFAARTTIKQQATSKHTRQSVRPVDFFFLLTWRWADFTNQQQPYNNTTTTNQPQPYKEYCLKTHVLRELSKQCALLSIFLRFWQQPRQIVNPIITVLQYEIPVLSTYDINIKQERKESGGWMVDVWMYERMVRCYFTI